MSVDLLIQTISKDCVPNIIAAETFRPRSIIWIYVEGQEAIVARLKQLTSHITDKQIAWQVDAADTKSMHDVLLQRFKEISPKVNNVLFHLSSGPTAMQLQGLIALSIYKSKTGKHVEAVVMDDRNCMFDVVFPVPKNNVYSSQIISLDKMLHSFGNELDQQRPSNTLQACLTRKNEIEELRKLAPLIKKKMYRKHVHALNHAESKSKQFEIRDAQTGKKINQLPSPLLDAFHVVQNIGLLSDLKINANNTISYKQVTDENPYVYINGGWLEDWLGLVLAELEWNGAGTGVHVLIGKETSSHGRDSQELDFLGARHNRLVYWSCKHTARLTAEQLFEVDALRDEMSGDGRHVVGILHGGEITQGLLAKAKRLEIHVVNAWADAAAKKILDICR